MCREEARKEVKSSQAIRDLRDKKWALMPNLAYALVYYMYKGGEHRYTSSLSDTIQQIFTRKDGA